MPNKQTRKPLAVLLLTLVLLGCGETTSSSVPAGPTTIRIAHLTDYAWKDRNQTGQPVDFKPEEECKALFRALQDPPADVLVIRGLGSNAAFERFTEALSLNGQEFQSSRYFQGATPYEGLGILLKRSPGNVIQQYLIEPYEVQGRRYTPLAFGTKTEQFWIWNAVWPEPSENYERRRNEARLLAQKLRPLIQKGEAVLVTLHSREDPDSPMFRYLRDLGLKPVIAADARGDRWTHRDPEGITYRQDQWIFATPDLAARLKGSILDTPDIRLAGDYRHQLLSLAP